MLEAERRRRRAGTGPSGPAAPFPSPRTFTGPQSAGGSGARRPRPLRPLHSLFRSEAQVASSPGRSWIIPDLAAHRPVSWLSSLRQHAALISPQLNPPFNFFIPAPSSQTLSPSFVFCPLLQGCFQSCIMWAPLLCPLYLCLVLHSHLTLILVETQDSSLTPNFLSVRLTWEGDSLLFPALCRALWQHFGSSCCPRSHPHLPGLLSHLPPRTKWPSQCLPHSLGATGLLVQERGAHQMRTPGAHCPLQTFHHHHCQIRPSSCPLAWILCQGQ